jgi:hypothetical protein
MRHTSLGDLMEVQIASPGGHKGRGHLWHNNSIIQRKQWKQLYEEYG